MIIEWLDLIPLYGSSSDNNIFPFHYNHHHHQCDHYDCHTSSTEYLWIIWIVISNQQPSKKFENDIINRKNTFRRKRKQTTTRACAADKINMYIFDVNNKQIGGKKKKYMVCLLALWAHFYWSILEFIPKIQIHSIIIQIRHAKNFNSSSNLFFFAPSSLLWWWWSLSWLHKMSSYLMQWDHNQIN